jgi:hypothetical protein
MVLLETSDLPPCVHCGACCATYRVSFFEGEVSPIFGGTVPPQLTEHSAPHLCCMRGTNQQHPHCIALSGVIGLNVQCTTYLHRPSTCRDFGFHKKKGLWQLEDDDLRRCNKARKLNNLPPLDFLHYKKTHIW